MFSETVQLRHPVAVEETENGDEIEMSRRPRPRSATYAALRSAVYQLTSMADFQLEKIGAGFFADVYKVKHYTTGEVMVLKMNKSRKTSKSMLSEIQLMNRLSHPNILKFKGSCVHEGHLHALTEYINGGSLEELLIDKEVKLPWPVRLRIIKDTVCGMQYLHSKNIIHRDLNPKNCLIQRKNDGKLKLVVADFGLAAKIKQRRRRSHTEIVGSPYWMAPECLKGKNYCEQADVFSFGITLAEIIARIPADPDFMPRTQTFGLDVDALRPMCDDCPEALFQLLDRCCQLDPDDRPTFEEIHTFLESVHLPDESDDDGVKTSSETVLPSMLDDEPHRDLRACISEPSIRLMDNDAPDDDSRSCGSEEESRLIIERHLPLNKQRLLGSLGSSTGSSCGSVLEDTEEEEPVDSVHQLEIESGIPEQQGSVLAVGVDEKGVFSSAGPSAGERSSNCGQDLSYCDPDSGTAEGARISGLESTRISGLGGSECSPRRTTIGTSGNVLNVQHAVLCKSKSLNTEAPEDEQERRSCPHHLLSFPLAPSSDCLHSSVQTLVAEDGIPPCKGVGRGGDSGIDPGELDVFKFPIPCSLQGQCSASEVLSCDHGDCTPICTSPNLYQSASSSEPILKGVAINSSHDQASVPLTSPAHNSHFSYSSSEDFDGQNPSVPPDDPSVPPNDRCASPMDQSWTSSEFSFSLPPPSTPWAPPSSPQPPHTPHSLPASPTHHHSYHGPGVSSHDWSPSSTSCLRKTTSYGRPKSCRNSALFPDLRVEKEGLETGHHLGNADDIKRRLSIKSVHFVDLEDIGNRTRLCDDRERMDYPTDIDILAGRPRSKSNPQQSAQKGYEDNFQVSEGNGKSQQGEYGIRLKSDWLNADPHSCKCYKIAQKCDTRLSNSAPDLTKLIPFLVPAATPQHSH